MAISQIPALTAHISWQLIYHCYSESSTFGRPGLGRCTPIWVAISLIPTLTTLISFLLWELIIWQTRSWQIYPPSNGNFTDSLLWQLIFHSYSESSSFGRPGPGRSIPHSNGNFTDCCSDSSHFMTAHISFLLWELIIWQTRSWQMYPPIQWVAISEIAALTTLILTLRAYHLADQVLADVTPHIRWQINRFLLYSESSYMADWVLADQHPPSYGNFTDCCSDSSYFIPTLTAPHLADQVLADLPPSSMAISQIPALLWKLIFGRPSFGRSTPHHMAISQIAAQTNSYFSPTLKAPHLADQVLADLPPSSMAILPIPALLWKLIFGRPSVGRSNPPHQWQFHRFPWNSYFILTLTAQHLADQVLADLPPHQMAISQIPALLWKLIIGRPSVGRSTPCQMAILQIAALTAHISFLLWELTTLRAQHLADQFLSDVTPHIRWQFHRLLLWQLIFHSYFESSSFGRPGPDSSTPIQWWFHRFLWNSYFIPPLSAYHLADQVLADLPPFNNNCAHICQTKWWQI